MTDKSKTVLGLSGSIALVLLLVVVYLYLHSVLRNAEPENLALGVEVRRVLSPQHLKQGLVIDLPTGRVVSSKQSHASLGWSRLAGPGWTDKHCMVVTNGLEISTNPATRVPGMDLWEVTQLEQQVKFSSPHSGMGFSMGPFVGPTAVPREGFLVLPYKVAFRTPSGDIGIIEIMSVRDTDIQLRYKFIASGEASR